MDILAERAGRMDEILQGKFITNQLKETAQQIDKYQKEAMSGFKSDFWNNRKFTIDENTMELKHDKRERFVDMHTRTRKDGSKHNKQYRIVHNKIIWGQYNYLTRELAYGYTDAVKEELKLLEEKT